MQLRRIIRENRELARYEDILLKADYRKIHGRTAHASRNDSRHPATGFTRERAATDTRKQTPEVATEKS